MPFDVTVEKKVEEIKGAGSPQHSRKVEPQVLYKVIGSFGQPEAIGTRKQKKDCPEEQMKYDFQNNMHISI
jgi:hypothetical protein